MKKVKILTFILALVTVFSLASCGEEAPESVNVYYLTGTTGFGMAKLMSDYATNETYTFTSSGTDASKVQAALISGDADIATLPTNAAATVYNRTNGEVQILAINTLGCLYLLNNTGTPITDLSQLNGKTVYTPAQNPSFIFKHICQKNNLNVNIVSTMDANTLSSTIASPVSAGAEKIEYAVLPEPVATATITKASKSNITLTNDLDLTAEWNKIEPANSLVQGCLVARREFVEAYPETVEKFLADYKASIEYMNTNVAESAQLVIDLGLFGGAAPIAQKAIPKCNIAYMDGDAMKAAMTTYLNVLKTVAPQSIGDAIPADDFYYIPEK